MNNPSVITVLTEFLSVTNVFFVVAIGKHSLAKNTSVNMYTISELFGKYTNNPSLGTDTKRRIIR